MTKDRSPGAVRTLLVSALAAVGLSLFWNALGSDSLAFVALGAAGLVVGLTAAGVALKRLIGWMSPGALERIEQDEWLETAAPYREPGPFRVVLEAVGGREIDAIKAIREVTCSDVARARELAEGAPVELAQGVSPASADRIAQLLRGAGASVRIEGDGIAPTAAPSP